MRTSVLQILWQLVIILCTCASRSSQTPAPNCTERPSHPFCPLSTTTTTLRAQQTGASTVKITSSVLTDQTTAVITNTTSTTTHASVNQTAAGYTVTLTNATVTSSLSSSTKREAATSDSGSNTTVIVAASVGTCAAVIFVVLFFLIRFISTRRRPILKNCNLPHKQPGDKKSTSFSNNMYPDIEGTSDDNKYAEIPLDNLTSITNEENVYQTIDPLQEQETVIDDKYSHICGNAWPLANASYSHIAGDFQSKRVVPDYTHIAKLEGTPKGDLKLKRNESDTSYDIIGKTKFGVTENLKVMEPAYNHTHNEINQTGTSKSDVDNYSHLHDLAKTMQHNETMINIRYDIESDEPVSGSRLKEGDDEPVSIEETDEKEPPAVVKLEEESKFALTDNCEENAVDHQYFVLAKVDKTEEKEPPAVVKLPEASKFSLTDKCEENIVDHQYFVLERVNR